MGQKWRPNYAFSTNTPIYRHIDTYRSKVKTNTNWNKACGLISDLFWIRRLSQINGDIMFPIRCNNPNKYAFNYDRWNKHSRMTRRNSASVARYFSFLPTEMALFNMQKISKDIVKLCTSHQLNTVNICRTSLSKATEHKLLPCSHGTFSNAGHIQDHKMFYKRKEIVQCLCLDDQNTVKLN